MTQAWTEEEIIAGVRQYAAAQQLPPPAPVQAADDLESAVGHGMPVLLRRLYCEVANGGFGVDGDVVSLVDAGQWYSDEESLTVMFAEFSSDPEWPYPRHILPLATMGCAIWWFVDWSSPVARMWGWDPNVLCEQHQLFPERFTLAQWLTEGLQGRRLSPVPPRDWPPPPCPDC